MRKVLPVFVLLIFTGRLYSQNVFTGVVKDNKLPVSGAAIIILDSVIATTDSTGRFSFFYADTVLNITVSATGFDNALQAVFSSRVNIFQLKARLHQSDEVIVYAFNSNSANINTTASVAVINRAAIEQYGSTSFVQVLNTVPGVKMDERSPGSYRLSIRGNLLRSAFGVRNVKVYWNGLPFTDASGNTYLNAISPTLTEKAEVIKGPAGSMYGAGTGGVILLRSNEELLNTHKGYVQVSGGSYGTLSAAASYTAGGRNAGNNITASHQQSDGYRQQSAMRRDNIFYNLSAKAGRHTFSGLIFINDLFYETPGGLTAAELLKDPKQARPAAGAFPGAAAQKASIRLKLLYTAVADEIKFNDQWSNTTGIYLTAVSQQNPAIRNYEDKNEKGAGGRSVFQLKKESLTITAGGEFQYGYTNTAIYGNQGGVKDTLQYHDLISATQLNIFIQSVAQLPGGFQLSAGLSYNDFYYGFKRKNIAAGKDEGNFDPQFIPRITLLKKIKNYASVFTSYSKGYSPPSIDEIHASDGIFNKDLNAESGTNYEAGVKVSLLKNRLTGAASYYIFTLKNTIVSRRDASGADYYVNAGNTDQKGFEGLIKYSSFEKQSGTVRSISTFISYTNTGSFFKNYKQGTADYSGRRLTGTPYNTFAAGASASFCKGWYGSVSFSHTGEVPLNDANTFTDDPYTLLFSRIGIKIKYKKTAADIFITMQKSLDNIYSAGNDLNAAGNRFYNASPKLLFNGGAKIDF